MSRVPRSMFKFLVSSPNFLTLKVRDQYITTVINMSPGGPMPSPTIRVAVQYAADKGVIMVCAAGNEGDNNPLTNEIGEIYLCVLTKCFVVGFGCCFCSFSPNVHLDRKCADTLKQFLINNICRIRLVLVGHVELFSTVRGILTTS